MGRGWLYTHSHNNRGKGESYESKPFTVCTLLSNRGAQHNCAPNFNNPTAKAPESTQNRLHLSFCTQFHECCTLLGSAVRTLLQKSSQLFLTFPFNHGFQHFILLLFSERKNGKEISNSALKTAAALFKAKEPPTYKPQRGRSITVL